MPLMYSLTQLGVLQVQVPLSACQHHRFERYAPPQRDSVKGLLNQPCQPHRKAPIQELRRQTKAKHAAIRL